MTTQLGLALPSQDGCTNAAGSGALVKREQRQPGAEQGGVGPQPARPRFTARYLAYCRAHGHTTDEQFEADSKRYPGGGAGTGFILWLDRRIAEWRRIANCPERVPLPAAVFDRWLAAWVEAHR